MMKKLTFILIALMAITASAQGTGVWKSHPKYLGSEAQNLVDATNKVYLVSNNHLFAFDKSTGDISPFDKDNGASDLVVKGLYHNSATNYSVVAYNNSNIDVIRPDGKVVNIPDIKDAIYNGLKGINDVTFGNGMIYVATQFGLVIIDDSTLQIRHTYYYNRNINTAAKVGNILFIASDDEIFYDTRANHDNFTQFVSTGFMLRDPHFFTVNDTTFFVRSMEELSVIKIENTDGINYTNTLVSTGAANNIQRTPTGFIANFKGLNCYYTLDENAENATRVSGGSELYSCSPNGDGTMWAVGNNGLHQKDSTTYYKPNGWGISVNQFYSTYNPGNGNVYVSRTTDNGVLNKANNTPTTATTEIWRYDGDNWYNATPARLTNDTGNYWLCFEPGKDNSYFFSGRAKSIVHVVNDTVVQTHNTTNSPITFMNALAFDKDGNLWGVQSFRAVDYGGKYNPYVIVLPKDKLNDAPNIENWITPNLTGRTGSNKASTLAISKGTDIKVFSIGSNNGPIMFWDNEGDINNLNPKNVTYLSLPDADGTTIGWRFVRCLTPDSIGNIWAGTTSGFLYFNPAEAFQPNFKVHRIKIKMDPNSETDYFLDGVDVLCIAVDSNNRKWLGTNGQGVYLLSDDGKKIIAQFDATNSSLPSNIIYTICPKPNSNSVIFVTSEGIAEYFYEATNTVDNYDNVQAYPNPLRPDFTGYVTINNLVNNSVLKITDRKGNAVALLQAQGSIAKWDGCNETGERLATGVYNVYAGPDAEHLSTNAVTQIRIIK